MMYLMSNELNDEPYVICDLHRILVLHQVKILVLHQVKILVLCLGLSSLGATPNLLDFPYIYLNHIMLHLSYRLYHGWWFVLV